MALASLLGIKAPNSSERGVGETVKVFRDDLRHLDVIVSEHAVQSFPHEGVKNMRSHRINLPTNEWGDGFDFSYDPTGLVVIKLPIKTRGVPLEVYWSPVHGEVVRATYISDDLHLNLVGGNLVNHFQRYEVY